MEKHHFRGSVAMGCVVPGCGKGFTDEIHDLPLEIPTPVFPKSPMDDMIAMFPVLFSEVLTQKSNDQSRTDIVSIFAALCRLEPKPPLRDPNVIMDTACYLYQRLKSNISKSKG